MEVLSEDFKKKASFLEINKYKNPRPLRNEYITPNVPPISLTNVPGVSLLNVPLFTGCN